MFTRDRAIMGRNLLLPGGADALTLVGPGRDFGRSGLVRDLRCFCYFEDKENNMNKTIDR